MRVVQGTSPSAPSSTADSSSMRRRLWRRLIHAYDSVQVELRGSYSVERMLELHESARSRSLAWCFLVLVATPLPCVIVAVLIDAVPLEPSSTGLAQSHWFWWRVALVAGGITFTILEQLRAFVPRLSSASRLEDIVMALVTGAGGSAYGLLMASLIGYPLPFTLFMGAPSWQVLFWTCVWIKWGRELRHDRALRSDVIAFFKVVALRLSLTVVYPAYNHVFTGLEGRVQTIFALGLPVLKLFAKNAFHWVFQHAEDFLPEEVILNVEVFHALFVATCMQSSTSISTTAVIMLTDLVQAWAHIRDVDVMLSTLQHSKADRHAPSTSDLKCRDPLPKDAAPLMIALVFVGVDRSLQNDRTIRLEASAASYDAPHTSSPVHSSRAAIHPVGPPSAIDGQSPKVVADLRRLTNSFASCDLDQIQHTLTTDGRRAYVATVLRVLRFTEYLLLIEFVEVTVPLVYCVYLIAIAHMPNRAFYPQVARLDNQSLWSTVGTILAYVLLELLSFVALCVVLQRKLRFSPVRQLAFVLHKQWKLVQSKMILWVVVIVGTSLEQFGYDYTFQFAWLGPSPSPTPHL